MLKDILKILENDARATPKQIAAMTGMPQAEIARLIKKAQQDHIILKYKAIVNWTRQKTSTSSLGLGSDWNHKKMSVSIPLQSAFIAFRRRAAFTLFPATLIYWSSWQEKTTMRLQISSHRNSLILTASRKQSHSSY
jgi:DNA-binding Lrp family transcriptional regulator